MLFRKGVQDISQITINRKGHNGWQLISNQIPKTMAFPQAQIMGRVTFQPSNPFLSFIFFKGVRQRYQNLPQFKFYLFIIFQFSSLKKFLVLNFDLRSTAASKWYGSEDSCIINKTCLREYIRYFEYPAEVFLNLSDIKIKLFAIQFNFK